MTPSQLASFLSFNRDPLRPSFYGLVSRGGGNLPPAGPKSRPITRAKFLIEKQPNTYKNDSNLLIFLDLTCNRCKNFKFYSLQGQNVHIFLIFTYNQGNIFLSLPITQGGGTCILVSTGSCPPPPCFASSDSCKLQTDSTEDEYDFSRVKIYRKS